MKIKSFSIEQTECSLVITALTEDGELFIRSFDLRKGIWNKWENISEDLPTDD